jgi:hypothetical protein
MNIFLMDPINFNMGRGLFSVDDRYGSPPPPPGDTKFITTESGDILTTESGDRLITEGT